MVTTMVINGIEIDFQTNTFSILSAFLFIEGLCLSSRSATQVVKCAFLGHNSKEILED